jgi:pilus assembly protein CpaB
VEDKNGQRVVVGKTATLELSPRQAEGLAAARQVGTLQLALRSIADSDPSKRNADDDANDRPSGRVNLVRFGIPNFLMPR